MENEISSKDECVNTPQSNDELTTITPPIELPASKASDCKCLYGREWDFFWRRFLRVL